MVLLPTSSSFRQYYIRHLLESCLSWLHLLGCRLCSACGRNKSLDLRFSEPFIMDLLMPGPVFCSTLLLWLCLPHKTASCRGILPGFSGCIKHASCPAALRTAPGHAVLCPPAASSAVPPARKELGEVGRGVPHAQGCVVPCTCDFMSVSDFFSASPAVLWLLG